MRVEQGKENKREERRRKKKRKNKKTNNENERDLERPITRQRVTEHAFCDCVICVNARIADQGFRADPAASFIDESGGFYPFWEKVSDDCAWDAWKGCYLAVWDGVPGKMVAQMMEKSGATLMSH